MLKDDGLDEFPGCCGVQVLHDFPEDDECHDLAATANEVEEDNTKFYAEDEIPVSVSRADIRSRLFKEAPMIFATTIPSQRYANRVLPLIGFIPQNTFKGRTGNRITLWQLTKG